MSVRRWAAYYAAHPDKLKARLEREARKGKVKRGRTTEKETNYIIDSVNHFTLLTEQL